MKNKHRLNMKKEKIYKEGNIKESMILPGDPFGLPDVFSRVIVFVDNAYLLRPKNHFFKERFNYSLRRFVESLAKKNKLFVSKIYLYDAPPFQSEKPNEKENRIKEDYDRFVSFFTKEGIVVREGRTQRLRAGDSFVYSQKGVDMLLGIDMVGSLKEFPDLDKVVLLSGDSDFVPAVEKVKSLGVKVILWTYFERNRRSPFSRSNHLIKSVDEFIKITREDFKEVELI